MPFSCGVDVIVKKITEIAIKKIEANVTRKKLTFLAGHYLWPFIVTF
jgi:hypothetical protein